jgi:hypothetical protein
MEHASLIIAASLVAATAAAQAPVGPPIRKISTASALSTEQIGGITSVRELPGGRVLVNDGQRRRLLLMDSTLKTIDVVLDSLTEVVNAYGVRAGALIAYRGDSTLFIDPASYAVLVLDDSARIVRVRSVPRVRDVGWIISGGNGIPGIDAKGRLVYRINAEAGPPAVAPPRGVPWFPQDPDSAFIVAMDFDTRKMDTLGSIRTPKNPFSVKTYPTGGFDISSLTNPMPATDDWGVVSDGSVAFVRYRDYRIEYLDASGKLTSSPKLPFDWVRLTDEDKQHIVDSVANQQRRQNVSSYVASMIRWVNTYNQQYPKDFRAPEGYVPSTGYLRTWKLPEGVKFPEKYIYGCSPGEEAVNTPAGTPSCIPQPVSIPGNVPLAPRMRESNVMDWKEMPDYRPPFNSGAVRADADGNLWIRTASPKPVAGGPVFDIVSREGQLVDRLQVPSGYNIVGFGKGRIVYLQMRDAQGVHLARVRLK